MRMNNGMEKFVNHEEHRKGHRQRAEEESGMGPIDN